MWTGRPWPPSSPWTRALWREEAKQIRAFYAQFGDKLPQTLEKELEGLEARLQD